MVEEKLDSVASKCEELGAKVITYCLDVTDQHAAESIDDFYLKYQISTKLQMLDMGLLINYIKKFIQSSIKLLIQC